MKRILTIVILFGAMAGVGGIALTQPIPAPSVPLFAPVGDLQLRAAVVPPPQVGTVRSRIALLDPVAFSQLRGGALALNLFDDAAFTAVGGIRANSISRGTGTTLWTGVVADMPYSNVILLTDAEGNLDLRVLTLGRSYFVQSVGGGLLRISEIDPGAGRYDASGQRVDDAVAAMPSEAEQREVAMNQASPRADDGSVIDILVVYTPAAVGLLGGEAPTRLAIEAAVALANVTYENSGVALRLRLVHMSKIEYVEGGNDLGRLYGTADGHMDQVHQWRNQYNADLVALIAGTPVAARNYCGIAQLPMAMPAPGQAFSITEALCINDITFAHEVGHNMGKAHDRANGFGAVHTYAYGYQDQPTGPGDYGDWVTVMAYSDGGACPPVYVPGVCPAVAYWSDKDATYAGKPRGSITWGEDNVRSLNETAYAIANYRISDDGGAATAVPQPTLTPIPTPGGPPPLPLNGSFEYDNDGDGLPDGWAWAGKAGKHNCGGAVWDGACVLTLKAGAKIRQTVPLDLAALATGTELHLSLVARPKSSGACASARLKIVYSDSTAGANGNGKDSFVLPIAAGPVKQWSHASSTAVLDATPSRVRLVIEAVGCGKPYRIDDVRIDVSD